MIPREAFPPLRIVIADDHAMVRSGLRKVLESQKDMQVVGEAADGEAAVRLTLEYAPDVLLLDLAMPGTPGVDALRTLSKSKLQTKTIIVTASIESSILVELVQLGARGVILKESSSESLYKCIRSVAAGQYWLDHAGVCEVAQAFRRVADSDNGGRDTFGLTPRELEIVAGVVAAYGTKEIAAKLNISRQTVKNHLTTIFDKIGVSNRLELALFVTNHPEFARHLSRRKASLEHSHPRRPLYNKDRDLTVVSDEFSA